MAQHDSDVAPDDDPVLHQLASDLAELEEALVMLDYHGHAMAARVIRKEIQNTKQLMGKWKALHGARLSFGMR
jgi:hypothetical protein